VLIPTRTIDFLKIFICSFLWGVIAYFIPWGLFAAVADLWPSILGLVEMDEPHVWGIVIVISGIIYFSYWIFLTWIAAYAILMIRYNANLSKIKMEKFSQYR
jgi:hypothetical protein